MALVVNETPVIDKGIVGFHDSRCAIHKSHSCNCALAAFIRKDKSCGNRFCMKFNIRCPSCGRVNGITD